MIEIATAVESGKELNDAVGALAKLMGKLKTQPDLAAQKLAAVLFEIAKTLQVVDQAASEYLSLGIDEEALTKHSRLLLDVDGGGLTNEVERGRGHCHVIQNIYHKYLDRWFARVLSPDEYTSVGAVFDAFREADSDLFARIGTVAATLEQEAGEVLNLPKDI